MFERFSPSAREAVVAARDEASRLGYGFVGTEHLLLGLLLTGEHDSGAAAASSVAATVLTASGIDAEYVRSRLVELIGPGTGRLGEEEADALQTIGIDLDAVRSKLEESFGEGVLDRPRHEQPSRRVPFTARAKKVLALSVREARHLHSESLESEHLLLGLIREGSGIAALILSTKVPLATLRDRVLSALAQAA
jgi:ATP-dependent Clp protease ATP-binding subunit ClpA